MSDSLQVVAERCNVKTKQVESQEELNQETHLKNSVRLGPKKQNKG